jgi:hypothetical protein
MEGERGVQLSIAKHERGDLEHERIILKWSLQKHDARV